MTTLYRKYRPQTFQDLAGQEFIVQTIMNEVAAGTIAHAYLFAGPRGVGKTTMARLLAKAINCERRKAGSSEPCNECTSCQEITIGRHIDVLEIDAASQTGVDNVRENIIENAQFKPTKAKYKIFIIDEVHMLSNSSFNALLKTLEEPPAHVLFILATTDLHKLPATVISRCQRFSFKRIGYDAMLTTLRDICKKEAVKVDDEVLTRIIAKSDGGMRDAESLLGQILSLNLKKITADDVALVLPPSDIEGVLDLLAALQTKNTEQAFAGIKKLVDNGKNLDQFMLDCLDTLRTIMIEGTGAGSDNSAYSKDQYKQIKKLAQEFTAHEIITLIDATMRRRLEMRTSPIPQLPLEVLIVQFTTAMHNTSRNPAATTPIAPEAKPEIKKETNTSATARAPIPPSAEGAVSEAAVPTADVPHANISSTIRSAIATSIDQIQQKWDAIIKKIGESNHSLTFVLKMCSLKQLDQGGLLLSVPYSLHKEKIEEVKSRRIIEDTIEAMFAERIPIACTVDAVAADPVEEINEMAMSFGGEVVGLD